MVEIVGCTLFVALALLHAVNSYREHLIDVAERTRDF